MSVEVFRLLSNDKFVESNSIWLQFMNLHSVNVDSAIKKEILETN